MCSTQLAPFQLDSAVCAKSELRDLCQTWCVLGWQDIMRDPVMCADGFSYERSAIEDWCAQPLGCQSADA